MAGLTIDERIKRFLDQSDGILLSRCPTAKIEHSPELLALARELAEDDERIDKFIADAQAKAEELGVCW